MFNDTEKCGLYVGYTEAICLRNIIGILLL